MSWEFYAIFFGLFLVTWFVIILSGGDVPEEFKPQVQRCKDCFECMYGCQCERLKEENKALWREHHNLMDRLKDYESKPVISEFESPFGWENASKVEITGTLEVKK